MKRNTHQQKTVQDALIELTGQHPTAEMVYAKVKTNISSVSRATVYRILNQLSDDRIINKVHIPYSAERYDIRTDPHYHLKCNACGKVVDIVIPRIRESLFNIPVSAEYSVTGHDIVFTGYCSHCNPIDLPENTFTAKF